MTVPTSTHSLELLALAAVAAKASEDCARHKASATDAAQRLRGALGENEALRRDLVVAMRWAGILESMVPAIHREPLRAWFTQWVSGEVKPRVRVRAGGVRVAARLQGVA